MIIIICMGTLVEHSTTHIICNLFICTGGCRTYRKTLAEKSKHAATAIKKKKFDRSRKQRVSDVS